MRRMTSHGTTALMTAKALRGRSHVRALGILPRQLFLLTGP